MMYALEAAVRSRPTPPHEMVARRTLIPELLLNTLSTLARAVVDRAPCNVTHLMDLVSS